MATPPEAVEERRGLAGAQIALIVLGVVLLLAALWFLVLRGGDEPEESAAPPPATTEQPEEPEPSEEPAAPQKNGPVETFEVFAPKDPFKALVADSAGSTAGSGDTSGGAQSGGNSGSSTSGTTTTSSSGSRTASNSDVGGHTVRLVDAFSDGGRNRAQVEVDGTVYTVDEGERFADNFELVSVQGACASMLFGDDQFTLCEGEEILK